MNHWLDAIKAVLFPYRTHLEQEIEYLRSQLAQERRRVDELLELKQPKPVVMRVEQLKATQPQKPRGWAALKAKHRQDEVEREKEKA